MLEVNIHIKGVLDKCWLDWFNGLEMHHTETGDTLLKGTVADTGVFYGIMARMNSLGLKLRKACVSEIDR